MVLLPIALLVSCKTPAAADGRVKEASSDDHAGDDACAPAESTWAGRMGMQLADDGQGGPVISCTAVGVGLVHIGLHKGDRIIALNGGTAVPSVQAFEDAAQQLASDTRNSIRQWEFTLTREGRTVTVKPPNDYPGCGVFAFDDCGPLAQ